MSSSKPSFHPLEKRADLEADLIFFDLFAGLGSSSIAAKWAGLTDHATYITEAGEEQAVQLPNLLKKRFPLAVVWSRIEHLTENDHALLVSIIEAHKKRNPRVIVAAFAGFPCQDLSCKGAGRGLKGTRSGLFAHLLSVLLKLNSIGILTLFCIENVASMKPHQKTLLERALGVKAEQVDANLWYPTKRARLLFTNIPHKAPIASEAIKQLQVLEPGWTTSQQACLSSPKGAAQTQWRTFMRAIAPGEPPELPSDFWHFSFVGYGIESLVVKWPLKAEEKAIILEHLNQGDAFTADYDLTRRANLIKWIHQEGGHHLIRPLCSVERGRALGYTAEDLYLDGKVPPRFSEQDWLASSAIGNCLSPRMILHICAGLKDIVAQGGKQRPSGGPPLNEFQQLHPQAVIKEVLSWEGQSRR